MSVSEWKNGEFDENLFFNKAKWMGPEWDEKVFYSPAEWMDREWNGDFFYELSKLGDIGCLKFSMEYGLISKRYECPKCGEDMKLHLGESWNWYCNNLETDYRHSILRSVRKGTWFQNSHISFGDILRLTYMWINKMPNESIMNDLRVANKTVKELKNFCRVVCIDYCLRIDGQVGGNGKIVDIYVGWLNNRIYKMERHAKRSSVTWSSVFVGLVRNSNDCFAEVGEDRSAEKLAEVLVKRVASGSTIIVSSGTMYNNSQLLFKQLETNHNVKILNTFDSSDGMWSEVIEDLAGNEFFDGEFNGEVAEHIWRRKNNYPITRKVQNFLKTISESFTLKSKD